MENRVAIIQSGGKQYKVTPNDVIKIEKLPGEKGDIITLPHVVLFQDGDSIHVGAPLLAGASVNAEIINQQKAKKVIVFKKIRRHNYRRKNGHRQQETVLRIKEILLQA